MVPSILVIDDSKTARRQVIEILSRNALFQNYFEAADDVVEFKLTLNN